MLGHTENCKFWLSLVICLLVVLPVESGGLEQWLTEPHSPVFSETEVKNRQDKLTFAFHQETQEVCCFFPQLPPQIHLPPPPLNLLGNCLCFLKACLPELLLHSNPGEILPQACCHHSSTQYHLPVRIRMWRSGCPELFSCLQFALSRVQIAHFPTLGETH